MAFRITEGPKPEKVFLESLDAPETSKEQKTFAVIRHATGEDQLKVSSVVNSSSYIFETDTGNRVMSQTTPVNYLDFGAKVWTVLEECNIEDSKGKPLFTKNMDWNKFLDAWSLVGTEGRSALRMAMAKVNPHWNFPTIGGAL